MTDGSICLDSNISIHALLAESDTRPIPAVTRVANFYPRSPCGERRQHSKPNSGRIRFLSTLSLRRATGRLAVKRYRLNISIHALLAESDPGNAIPVRSRRDFYPRSPCGERQQSPLPAYTPFAISIHALLAESDPRPWRPSAATSRFLSTLSLRRATKDLTQWFRNYGISIHALLAESDYLLSVAAWKNSNFYPRSPCGERQ